MEVQSQLTEEHNSSVEYILHFYLIKDDSGQPTRQHVGTFVWNQTDPVYLLPITSIPGFIRQTLTKGVVLPPQTKSTTVGPRIIYPINGLEFLNAIRLRYGQGTRHYTSQIILRPKTGRI